MPKKELQSLWSDVRIWLEDATKSAIKEAEDLTRRGRIKVELMRLSREIQQSMAALGGLAYDRLSREPDAPLTPDPETRRLVQEISRLETDLKRKQQEYEAEKKKR